MVIQARALVSAVDGGPRQRERAAPGSRAGEIAEIGGLLVTATPEVTVSSRLVTAVRDWLVRSRGEYTTGLVIGDDKIVMTGISAATQERLIDAWLRAPALDAVGEDWLSWLIAAP